MNIIKRLYNQILESRKLKSEMMLDSFYLATHKPPMGVSQWRAHGEKYGYWEYFKEQILKETGRGQRVSRRPHKAKKVSSTLTSQTKKQK